MLERRKELRRRRKRKKEKAREKRKAVGLSFYKQKKTMKVIPKDERPNQTEREEPTLYSIEKSLTNYLDVNWDNVRDLNSLMDNLPKNIKPKQLWPMPTSMKSIQEEIIQLAVKLKDSRQYAAPGEWNGGVKEALILMKKSRLPRGFQVFLEI